MTLLVVDTSVAVPLVVQPHTAHHQVTAWWSNRKVALSGHALIETYSVLTRLPGDIRLTPADAVTLLKTRFAPAIHPSPDAVNSIPELFGRLGIAGGAVYDGLVAMAALEHDALLATRDVRARATYELVGARVQYVR